MSDKPPPRIHHAQVIRADLTLVTDPIPHLGEGVPTPSRRSARTSQTSARAPETLAFQPPTAVPSWARASGRAGEDPLFAAGAGLALLDAHLRRDPPAAGALRSRLALQSAAASAKILRLNGDAGALRDMRFAVGDALGPAAKLLELGRDLVGRPPSLDARRLAIATGLLDLPVANADALAETLREQGRAGDPVSAAAKAAALAFCALPDAPPAEAEILALWAFDMVIAIRLRWPRPLPLIATKILDPALRPPSDGRRPRPDEAARHAPMTDRAARRLFDRLVALGAAREFSGRPTFWLYGL